MTRRIWTLVPGAVAASLLLAACGGGGDATVSSAADAPAAQAPAAADASAGTDAASAAAATAGTAEAPAAGADAAAKPSAAHHEAPAASVPAAGAAPVAPAATVAGTTEAAPAAGSAAPAAKPSAGKAAPAAKAGKAADQPAVTRSAGAAAKMSAEDQRVYDEKQGATDVGVTKDSIKLGSVNMHGMALGNLVTAPVVRGNLATITSFNDRGGILGRRLSLVDCDDGPGEVARAKACIKKMVEQDHIFSLIGGIDWATASIHDDLRSYNLPYVGAWAYSQTEWQDPYMFPTHMSMIHEAMAGANWAKAVIKPKTYGLICLTSPEMQLACDQVEKVMGTSSKLVKRADVAISEPTMAPVIVAMRAAAPDHIIHYVINPATMAKFMIEAEQQNYYPPQGVSGNHLAAEALGPLFGKHAAGRYWSNTTYKLWGTEFMAIMNKYARANAGRNHHNVQSTYVGLNFLFQAAKAVGPNLTREKLMAQLNNGEVYKSDISMDQKFSYAPSERKGENWNAEYGQNREFMYKMNSVNTASNPDGTPQGWIPDPGQFVIKAKP